MIYTRKPIEILQGKAIDDVSLTDQNIQDEIYTIHFKDGTKYKFRTPEPGLRVTGIICRYE